MAMATPIDTNLTLLMSELRNGDNLIDRRTRGRWVTGAQRRKMRLCVFKFTRPHTLSTNSVHVDIWLEMATLLKIQRKFYFKLYGLLQERLCAPGGRGRKRDLDDYKAEMLHEE